MKRITIILAAVMALALTSCLKDEFSSVSLEHGGPVTATLSLDMATSPLLTVTKAAADNDYSSLNSLMLLFFNANGTYSTARSTEWTDEDTALTITGNSSDGTGVHYYVNFTIETGTYQVIGIANYTNVERWDGAAEGGMTFAEYIADLLTRLEAGTTTYNSLLDEIIYTSYKYYVLENVAPTFNTNYVLSTGCNESITVTTDGASGNLMMYRGVANIEFNIASEYQASSTSNIVNFTPSYYAVYNLPKGVWFDPAPTVTYDATADGYYDTQNYNIATATGGTYSFNFFMPENIQDDVNYNESKTFTDGETTYSYSGYTTRDAWDWTTTAEGAEKNWLYAPDNATYVVITGQYNETDYSGTLVNSGTASYTIHLGNFSDGNYGNYTVKRNCSYIYNVTVKGVDNVITEVQTDADDSPGSEASIVHLESSSLNFVLDAHYEQVLVSYNLSEIVSAVQTTMNNDSAISQADAIGENMILQIETPFQTGAVQLQPYAIYANAIAGLTDATEIATAAEAAKTAALASVDYKWVEFWPQTGTTIADYPGIPSWNSSDGTDSQTDSQYLLDAYDMCVAMGMVVNDLLNGSTPTLNTRNSNYDNIYIVGANNGSGTEYYARFTGFVTEYYYVKHPIDATKSITWGDFADKDPRRLIISLNTEVSADDNSSYSTIHTSISQYAIQTFYDPEHAASLNAFGVETFNESRLCSTFGVNSQYTYTANDSDGLENFETLFNRNTRMGGNGTNALTNGTVAWTTYLASGIGWTESVTAANGEDGRKMDMYQTTSFGAWYACLSRNRDLNGDGTIDYDEVMWYLPAIDEYILLSLGENALSNECRLYFGDKSAMTNAGYPSSYLADGAIYYSSSSGIKRMFWAVERGAYGYEGNDYSGSVPLRCTRRLPVALEDHDCVISDVCTVSQTSAGNYIADMSDYFETDIYRTSRIASGALNPHNEEDSENKLYYGFVVPTGSDGYIRSTLTNIAYYSAGDNLCGSYSEESDGSDLGAWRTPNLSELYFISKHADELNPLGYTGMSCCTQFSNTDVRYGYQLETNINCSVSLNNNYYVRCVRDATDAELTAAAAYR